MESSTMHRSPVCHAGFLSSLIFSFYRFFQGKTPQISLIKANPILTLFKNYFHLQQAKIRMEPQN
jgi:hypothetical protein